MSANIEPQEGYSHDDSVQAADAVVKFHEANKLTLSGLAPDVDLNALFL